MIILAKLASLGLLKVNLFGNKDMISLDKVTSKKFSRD